MTMHLDEQLGHLPGDILLALALNENADPRGRKAAVEIMYIRDDRQVQHKDIQRILADVKADIEARHEVIDIVETATEEPLHTGASVASVTTQTLAGNKPSRNGKT